MTISIRPCEAGDGAAIYDAVMESFAELHPFMPWCTESYTLEVSNAWTAQQEAAFRARTTFEFIITDDTGTLLGLCGLNQLDALNHRANLGYWVRTSATRRGIATSTVRQLVQWGFSQTSLIRLEVVIAVENVASVRVAEKPGAVREGVLRRRLLLLGSAHDAVMLAFARD